jgi:nitroimidazol reductase NimA-like FMN-containing flavoprotein (pyridoxamine 5'-phosphate oxidase superfamily)
MMMTGTEPVTEIDARYGDPEATAIAWQETVHQLNEAELFWLTTVRQDGRPHITPLLAVWHDGAMHFCTGAQEQKARNLEHNDNCALTTGVNAREGGTDVVVEGRAVRVRDEDRLRQLAELWFEKYGSDWKFDVRDEAFFAGGHAALVFEVAPVTAHAFGKEPYSQTRYRF